MRRQPLVIVDGGHNPGSARSVRTALEDSFSWQRMIFVVGMVDSKPIEDVAAIWRPVVDKVIVTVPRTERAGDPQRIADAFEDAEIVPDVAQAVAHALALADPEDLVMIYGSFYTATEARDALRAHN
jgi:dihydrofolate synthase/folylpolyglutamate synthase